MKKYFPIEILEHRLQTVYFPVDVLSAGPINKISFGTITAEATCLHHPYGKNVIGISKDLFDRLMIPHIDVPLHVFINEETIYIGPLVGIFTSGFTPFVMRPVGERSMFFAKLLSVKKAVGALVFLFGEQHINWELGTIDGLFYNDHGWETITVPFPNVIYDRLPNRKSEKVAELRKVKDRLQTEYLIPWYNPGFFNKLDIYDRLQQCNSAVQYLPETHPFTSFSMIERMLGEYGHVYMKPINGSLGLGIHQLLYDKTEGSYFCRFRDSNGDNKLRKYDSLEALFMHVFQNRRLSNMLVQQGITLMRVDERPVDFRVHTNKDDQGKWNVTAIAAKIAGPGSVTTHINNGGSIKTIQEIFKVIEEQENIVRSLSNAALELSKALEDQMEGIIGEIGFDLGIDQDGKIWFFEANSKPGRSIFKHPHLKDFDLLSRKMSLAFAVFLAERAIKTPGEIFK